MSESAMGTAWQIDGSEDGPVLLFSHSLGTTMSMWQPQVDDLAPLARVVRYDTRGHGRSTVYPGPYTLEQLGQDVVALLDTLSIQRATFCGISLGGLIGLWLGLHHPERLDGLVLSNTSARFGTAQAWDDRIETVRQKGIAALIPGLMERWFTAAFRDEPAAMATRDMLSASSPEGYVACCAALRDADLRADLPTVRVPTLVLGAAHDPGVSDATALASAIPGAHYVELNGAHIASLEDAAGFNRAVRQFLQR